VKIRLSFSHTSEELFLVTAGLSTLESAAAANIFSVTVFDHEDIFLGLLMNADLSDRELCDTVQVVLLTINNPVFPPRWVQLDLQPEQIAMLRLNVSAVEAESAPAGAITESLDYLKHLLDTVRAEIRRQEALDALNVAEEELRRIAAIAVEMVRQHGLESGADRALQEIARLRSIAER
jgi:hypothetical protein